MTRAVLLASACLGLAACTQDLAPLPPTLGGGGYGSDPAIGTPVGTDPVMTSVMAASSYLADPRRRLAGRPALAAQVAAQYEFATVALREPRFFGFSPLMLMQMDQGRAALRDTLGVAQDAPSPLVIDRFTQLAGALGRGDGGAATVAATGAPFVKPAPDVLATLAAMPAVPVAGRAASFAEQQLNRPDANYFKSR
jgi:hypothetical protein